MVPVSGFGYVESVFRVQHVCVGGLRSIGIVIDELLNHIENASTINSHELCQAFGLSRPMMERLLMFLEDEGHIVLDRPASHCGDKGSCGTGGGAAAALTAMALAARQRKVGRVTEQTLV
jgi:hypothetical protein